MMGWYGDGAGGAGWIAMALVMVAFWGLAVFAVVAIFRGAKDTGRGDQGSHHDAREILDERFARGEIDVEEYRARQDVLRATHR